jgi:hypothetical protein
MADLEVWTGSRQRGTCRSCHRRIEWATVVASGRKMPLDAPVVITARTTHADGRLIDHIDTTRSPSHFATCPDAADWRRQGSRRA